ncbi:MAG: hypothetical protein VX982_01470 [Chloroflexota bacterium]|nr:hypothetical protein [Chloroflexota bacterium]
MYLVILNAQLKIINVWFDAFEACEYFAAYLGVLVLPSNERTFCSLALAGFLTAAFGSGTA